MSILMLPKRGKNSTTASRISKKTLYFLLSLSSSRMIRCMMPSVMTMSKKIVRYAPWKNSMSVVSLATSAV